MAVSSVVSEAVLAEIRYPPIQTRWANFNIASFLRSDVVPVLNIVSESIGIVSDVVTLVADILDIVAEILILTVDIIESTIAVARLAIEAIIRVFTETSVAHTWIVPLSFREGKTAQEAFSALAASLYDKSDPERPIATAPAGFIYLIFVASAPNIFKLQALIEALMELFGLPLPEASKRPVTPLYDKWPPAPQEGTILHPDWKGYRLSEIKPFEEFVGHLLAVRDTLARLESEADMIKQVIQMIRDRINQIEARIAAVLDMIERLIRTAILMSGVEVAVITGFGDTAAQAGALSAAPTSPGSPSFGAFNVSNGLGELVKSSVRVPAKGSSFAQSTGDEIVALYAMHTQVGGLGIMDLLLKIFGIIDKSEQIVDRAASVPGVVSSAGLSVTSRGDSIATSWKTLNT